MNQKTKVLYISWDGMTDPLGQSQVLSYLILLSKHNYSFDLISLDKPDLLKSKKDEVKKMIGDADINWHPVEFNTSWSILSTYVNLNNLWRKILELKKEGVDYKIIHARNQMSALVGVWYKRKFGTPVLFDMRGWFADERKESGRFNNLLFYPIYKYLKKAERKVFEESDIAISLTHVGKDIIVKEKLKEATKVEVIPTCVNFNLFVPFNEKIRQEIRNELKLPHDSTVMLYSGSLGGSYRIDLLLLFFKNLLEIKPDSYFIMLTHSDHSIGEQEIKDSGLPREKFRIISTSFQKVHRYLMAGDIGLIMYSNEFSVAGRSPTKLGEYWSAGLPVLSAKGIGDLEKIIETYPKSGVLVSNVEAISEYKEAVQKILCINHNKTVIRDYAIDYFDINKGIDFYLNVYKKLLIESEKN